MTEPNHLQDQLDGLNISVAQISGATVELAQRQAKQLNRLSALFKYAIITSTVAVLVFAGLLWKGYDNSRRIDERVAATNANAQKIEQLQKKNSEEVLCPLFDLFLDSYNVKGATALADPGKYQETFKTLEDGAVVLGCEHTKRGRN